MRKLIVGLFLFVYYSTLLLSVTMYMHACGFCLEFIAVALNCVVFFLLFCIIVTFGRYVRFNAFSKILLPSVFECCVFVYCSGFLYAFEFWFLRRAVESFVVGKIMIGIFFVLIDFGTLLALLFLVWKSSAEATFLKEFWRLKKITEGCDEIEIAVAYLPVGQQYVEPKIDRYSIRLDGVNNDAIVASAVIDLLGDVSWKRKALVAFKGGSRYGYLIVRGLSDFRIFDHGCIEDREAKGGVGAIERCRWYVYEYECSFFVGSKIEFWDFWTLIRLFSCFWKDDEGVQKVIGTARKKFIEEEIKEGKCPGFDSDYATCCFSRYLYGLLNKQMSNSL